MLRSDKSATTDTQQVTQPASNPNRAHNVALGLELERIHRLAARAVEAHHDCEPEGVAAYVSAIRDSAIEIADSLERS